MPKTKSPAKAAKAPKAVATKILSTEAVRVLALAAFEAEAKANPEKVVKGLSPAVATKAIGAKANRPVASLVALVYFAANGRANPLPASAAKSRRSLAIALRNRRNAGGTLARRETLAASAEATTGRRYSKAEIEKLLEAGGVDLAASYTGRGTRAAAPKTLADVSTGLGSPTK